jgi:hypothetical protein
MDEHRQHVVQPERGEEQAAEGLYLAALWDGAADDRKVPE